MSEQTHSEVQVRISVLGTLHLERRLADERWEDVPITSEEWGTGHPTRSFLRYLLAHGRCVGRSTVLDTLWTDVDSADRYLYNAASTLRRILRSDEQAPLLETIYNRTTYKLAGQSRVWVDVDHATGLLQEAKRSGLTSEHGLHLLQEAELLFRRGPLFADEPGDWCFGLREQTKTMQYRCQLWLAEAYEAHQQLAEAEIVVEALLTQDPTDERALRHLMTLLHKQGLTSEAVRRYKQTASFLKQKGLALSAETEAHIQAIQRGQAVQAQGFTLSDTTEQFISQVDHIYQSKTVVIPGMMHRSPDVLLWTNPDIFPSTSNIAFLPFNPLSLRKPVSINKETLHLLSDLTDVCRNLSEGSELQVAEQILWSYLPKIELFLQRTSEYREITSSIASQGYLLAASLVGHRNDLLKRLQYSKQALHYGKMAGDLNLQIVAMRQIAISFDCMDRPDKVLETYESIVSSLDKVSPLLRSCIYADMSGAHASLKHEQEAFHFLGIAYEHFPEQLEHEPAYLRTICRYASLTFWDGLNRLLLGKPKDAESAFAKIGGVQPQIQNPERNRVEVLNYQVEMFTTLGDMEQACFYLEIAVKAALAIGSIRRFQQEFALFQRMQSKWRHETHVQQLADLFISS